MLNGRSILAIIPARGGSKRLPRKNVLELGGKPLIAWTIESALNSKYIDSVVVTSDDDEVLLLSKNYRVMTIRRPKELAEDNSTSFEAIKHTLGTLAGYDLTVLLQPTSPLRTEHHIDEALQLLERKQADGIISVTEMEYSPLWANVLSEDGDMARFLKEEVRGVRSQDLATYYRLNGAIYISSTPKLLRCGGFFHKQNIYAYRMCRASSVDIDTEIDLMWAQFLIDARNKGVQV